MRTPDRSTPPRTSPLGSLALALMLLASARPTHAAAVRTLAVGDTLPPLIGHYLNGRDATVPQDSKGKRAFLALGFTYKSRYQVEPWAEHFRKVHGATPTITSYEVPVMGGMARIARPMIDNGMRKGTPAALHENVITVWQEAGEWKKRMGMRDPDAAYCALIDGAGVIRWLHAGPFSDEAWASLERALSETE
jgi:hypothetical protein